MFYLVLPTAANLYRHEKKHVFIKGTEKKMRAKAFRSY